MNGPEHFVEGERVLAVAETLDWQDPTSREAPFAALCIEAAKAHFAAAQVAATITSAATAAGVEFPVNWVEALS